MSGTDAAKVGEVIEVDSAISLDIFIGLANELTTEYCTGDNGPAIAYTATRLEYIERLLAAHFYTMRDPRAESEKAGPVSVKYQSNTGLNLANSHYGQQAMIMDTNGGLAALNKSTEEGQRRSGDMFWLGTEAD